MIKGISMNKKPRCYLSGAITGVKHADKLFARAADNIFAAISGAVLALMTIIFGLLYDKKNKA